MFRKVVILATLCVMATGCTNVTMNNDEIISSASVSRYITSHDLYRNIARERFDGTSEEIHTHERWLPITETSEAYAEYMETFMSLGYDEENVLCRYTEQQGENSWYPVSDATYEMGYIPIVLINEVDAVEKYISVTEINLLPGAVDKTDYLTSIIADGETVVIDIKEYGEKDSFPATETDLAGYSANGTYRFTTPIAD